MAEKALLLDLEGTIYTREGVIPGAHAALSSLRSAGYLLRFLTNTDSKTSATILAELHQLGLDVRAGELFTPVTAAAIELSYSASVVLPLTNSQISAELRDVARISASRRDGVTHVVVGDVRENLDYGLMDEAFRAIDAGARLVALQRGRFFLKDDEKHLDTGAIVAALEYAAGVEALVLGKPSRAFVQLAIDSLATRGDTSIWVIGDDRSTDIAMANDAGLRSVLVHTGKYAAQADDTSLPRAEFEASSIASLDELLRELA